MIDPTESMKDAAANIVGYSIEERRAFAAGIAHASKLINDWCDAGCPGLDRQQFVAFGPLGMLKALRDSLSRNDWLAQKASNDSHRT